MGRDFFGGRLLPVERPEHRTWLQERLEGRQIARLDYALTPVPEWGLGFTLTSGARLAMWSTEDRDFRTGHSRYAWRLMMRWIAPQRIVTPRMVAFFGRGRDSGLETAVTPHLGPDLRTEAADALQQQVEGEVIVGAAPVYEPNAGAGERIVIEFRGGGKLQLDALPPKRGDRTCRADLDAAWLAPPEKTTLWIPGMPR